jgi:4-alpha-glucanotransferase
MDDDRLREEAERRGIQTSYYLVNGERIEVPAETLRAVLAALRPIADEQAAVYVVREAQTPWSHGLRGSLELEDGSEQELPPELPGGLDPGYHVLVEGRRRTPLVIAPDRAHLPAALAGDGRDWGLAVQLYAMHSHASWGIGDLGDLARLVPATGGPGFLLSSPLHAPRPSRPVEPSPYFASTRFFRNPLHIAVEDVPEWKAVPGREALAARGRSLTATRLVDRDAVLAVKDEALQACFAAITPARRERLARFMRESPGIHGWGAYCGGDPAYHAYLQMLLADQLTGLPQMRIGLIADLAVGAAPDGFDAIAHRDALLGGLRVGAPPDPLGPEGQDWGVPAFDPVALAADGYALFAHLLRANMAQAAGLRIDHVMGLWRLFVIPEGMPASQGTYLRYPAGDLLAVLALESRRAQCLVIGEDLGTVEAGVREALAAHDILSYRVARFEERRPEDYPRLALAALTTHDLPTTARFLEGHVPPAEVAAEVRRLHSAIASTPSMLASAALDDVMGAVEQPNVPGTVDEHPNWRVRLPIAIEDLAGDGQGQAILAAIRQR